MIRNLCAFRHDREFFEEIRALDRTDRYAEKSVAWKAARMIYLNRTGFNGLYRTNQKGQFNVPFGKYANPTICNAPLLRSCSKRLQGKKIVARDFRDITEDVTSGDFVYLDPPYAEKFTGYNGFQFTEKDQEAVRDVCDRLHEKGVHWIASNSDCDLVRRLYAAYRIESVDSSSQISSKSESRGAVKELLISNIWEN